MKIKTTPPYLNLNHKKVIQKYNATKFIAEIQIRDSQGMWSRQPVNIYYSETPDITKGHKHYFYLYKQHGLIHIGGLYDIEEYRHQDALQCLKCNDVIYSRYTHDYASCGCNNVAIDGGRDYCRIMGQDYKVVTIDILKNEVIEDD